MFINTHTDKTTETKSNAVANGMTVQQSGKQETFQLEDNRPEAIAQIKIQETANNSEQVKQLKAVKALANNSPQVKQLRTVQAMADNHTAGTKQLKGINEGETVQKKFEPAQKRSQVHIDPGENKTGLPASSSQVVQRTWEATNNENLTAHPAARETLENLVAGVSRVPTQIKTIMPKTGSTHYRIDMQGSVRRGGALYANIQFQVGGDSVAGVICPFDLDIETVKVGLREALEADDVLEWEDEESEIPSSPHMDSLFEAAEGAGVEIDDFQTVFDEAIEELTPDMVRLFTGDEQYEEDEVNTAMEKVSLEMCLAQFTPGYVAVEGHQDLYSEEKWKQKFKLFARDYIKQELVSELPLQHQSNSHFV